MLAGGDEVAEGGGLRGRHHASGHRGFEIALAVHWQPSCWGATCLAQVYWWCNTVWRDESMCRLAISQLPDSKNPRSFASIFPASLVSHSQITSTFQPKLAKARSLAASRATVRDSLGIQ